MEKMREYLFRINDLQKTTRYGDNLDFNESTAEHTFKLILLVDYFYSELKLDLDYKRCIDIAIYHDFGELDLQKDVDLKASQDQKTNANKEIYEKEKIEELSNRYYKPIKDYFDEYESRSTKEARFVYACDKLEGFIYPQTVGKPIPNHELFATYADKAIANFKELIPIYRELKMALKDRYQEWGFEWKAEYEMVFDNFEE